MILAAGAILQSGKYVIQAVLHQTDLGITYQAYHVYLNQPVVLQTLNPDGSSAGQQFDFSDLRQQFVQQARDLAKHPSNHRLRAIDLFEEKIEQQNLPFVVLSFLPNQPPQKIGEWFAALPEPKSPIETAAIAAPRVEPTVKSDLSDRDAFKDASQAERNGAKTAQAVMVSEPVPAAQPRSEAATAAASIPEIPIAAGAASVTNRPRSSNSVRVYVQPQRRWSPNLFLLTALVAGAMGAGMGVALRMHPAQQSKTPFNLSNGLFTREQSFPSQGNWPIHETPQSLMPEPAANQPAYATEPALQYTPPIEPFPTTGYTPLPADPVPLPDSTAPQEAIETNPAPAESELESPVRLPPASATRDLPLPSQPAPIAPADPAPAISDPPAAAPPPAPAIDPPPAPDSSAARPLRPKTVDQ